MSREHLIDNLHTLARVLSALNEMSPHVAKDNQVLFLQTQKNVLYGIGDFTTKLRAGVPQVQVTDGMPRVGLGPHIGDPPGSLRGGAIGGVGRLGGLMTCGCVGSCQGHTTYGDYIPLAQTNEGGVTGD